MGVNYVVVDDLFGHELVRDEEEREGDREQRQQAVAHRDLPTAVEINITSRTWPFSPTA
jgi:hypothetical protein